MATDAIQRPGVRATASQRWRPHSDAAPKFSADARAVRQLLILARTTSAMAVATGCLVLAGWQLNIEVLKSVLPGAVTMKPLTAGCFVLSGLALGLQSNVFGRLSPFCERAARLSAAITALSALATLAQTLAGAPGRLSPAPATAAGFLLLGASLCLATNSGRWLHYADTLALGVLLVGTIALVSYFYSIEALLPVAAYSSMALHTAGLLIALGLGSLAAHPEHGLMATFTSECGGGVMARRILPLALTLPFVIGWLRLCGEKAGWYGAEFGLALFATSNISIFATLVWWSARSLNRTDAGRRASEEKLRTSQAQLETAQELAKIGSWEFDLQTGALSWSRQMYRLFDRDPSLPPATYEEFVKFVHPDDRPQVAASYAALLHNLPGTTLDFRTNPARGPVRHLAAHYDLRTDAVGNRRAAGTISDITEQKQAEAALQQQLELERRLKKIADIAPGAICSFRLRADGAMSFPYASPAMETICGLRPEDLARDAAAVFILMHPDDAVHVRETITESARTLSPWRAEFRIEHPDKGRTWVESHFAPSPEPDGSILWYGFLHDVTERKKVEDDLKTALREVNELKVALDEHAIVAITDPKGKITYVNDKFCQISKYSREELLGQDHRLVNSGHHSKEFIRNLWRTIARGHVWRAQMKNRAKDRSYYWVDTTIVPFLNERGKPRQYVAIRADITEQKLAEEALVQRTEQLVRSNTALEQFAYAASHDLQEPLRGVSGCLQLLHKRYTGQLDARADEFIAHAVNNLERMQSLIKGLLDYARVDRGSDALTAVDCAEVFHQVCENLSVAIQESGAQVTAGELPTVSGDRTQLGQLFQNLIGNAIKFRGEEPPRIHVSAERNASGEGERRAEGWRFSVRDNGIGVDPQYADRIFGVFQRLHTRGQYPGTGIGLAICKRVVERHGGTIWLESQPGRGSTFYFTIANLR